MESFSTSDVKIIPFLLFCIHGALGLISMSFSVIDLINYSFRVIFISGSLILGRQKESRKDTVPFLETGYIEQSLFLI